MSNVVALPLAMYELKIPSSIDTLFPKNVSQPCKMDWNLFRWSIMNLNHNFEVLHSVMLNQCRCQWYIEDMPETFKF